MHPKGMAGYLRWACDVRMFNSPKARNLILLVALVFFIGGLTIAFQQQPEVLEGLDWMLIGIVVLIGIPITVILNTFEFVLSGRLIGQRVTFFQALEVTTVGSAANLLPLPGGMAVRVLGLKSFGASYRDSISTTLFIALIWLGISFTYSGVWIHLVAPGLTALVFLAAGFLVLTPALIIAVRMTREWRTSGLIVGAKLAVVVADVCTVYLCLLAIGTVSSFGQA